MRLSILGCLAMILALRLPLAAGPKGPPDWVEKGTRAEKGWLHAVGIGQSLVDALANSLGDLAGLRETLVRMHAPMRADGPRSSEPISPSDRLMQVSEGSFGPILVSRRIRDDSEPGSMLPNGTQDYTQEVSSDLRVVMRVADQSLLIAVKMKSSTTSESKSRESLDLELHLKDLSFMDLIAELERQGITLRQYQDPKDGSVFAGLAMKPPAGLSTEDLEKLQKEDAGRKP